MKIEVEDGLAPTHTTARPSSAIRNRSTDTQSRLSAVEPPPRLVLAVARKTGGFPQIDRQSLELRLSHARTSAMRNPVAIAPGSDS